MATINMTRDGAERFARETGGGAHMQRNEPLTAEDIRDLMRRAAPGANQLLRDLQRDNLRGFERAGKLVLR